MSCPTTVTTANLCSAGPNQTDHGTAVAEIVHDMAPAAELRLVCVDSATDLEAAVDDAIANGIRIINASLGFLHTSRGDGLGEVGTPDHAVARAAAAGIVWVNAAGNYAQLQYRGLFDPGDNGYHDFSPGNDGNGVLVPPGLSTIFLRWDSWPTTDVDLDLYVYDVNLQLVSCSCGVQDGTQPPIERLTLDNRGSSYATAFIGVFADPTATGTTFDLIVPGAGLWRSPRRPGASWNRRPRPRPWPWVLIAAARSTISHRTVPRSTDGSSPTSSPSTGPLRPHTVPPPCPADPGASAGPQRRRLRWPVRWP